MVNPVFEVTLSLITCCNSACGIQFAVPRYWQERRCKDHSTFYCPNGHEQCYLRKTREEELREQLDRASAERIALASRVDTLRKERDNAHTAQKRETTRRKNLQKRITAGVCPYCSRHFAQVERHVHNKHPEKEHVAQGTLV